MVIHFKWGQVNLNVFTGNIKKCHHVCIIYTHYLYKDISLTTLALVLNGCNSSFLSPINASWHCSHIFIFKWWCSMIIGGSFVPIARGLKFFFSLIYKTIDAQLVRPISSTVERFNELHIILEYRQTSFLLCIVLISTSILSHPLLMPL